MPNSSGGQQEVEQQEEEGEVGEGAREQEFGQQDEERVVKRRITDGTRPISSKTSVPNRRLLQSVSAHFIFVTTITTAGCVKKFSQV